ncbi:ADAM 17-like protease isoform X1 [Clavelina lepadiformis]|uniref:ADAM 17-like protease isoform X1 n=1 Tax=Clavelina lepadiformis TaxID=159417 RepID=UPI0040437E69
MVDHLILCCQLQVIKCVRMKYNLQSVYLLFCSFLLANASDHPLHEKLTKWHTLKMEDLELSRHRRSTGSHNAMPTVDREVAFEAFNKSFILSLMPSLDIFSPGFKAFVHGKNAIEEINFDRSSIYRGKVLGDPNSEVMAQLNGKSLTAQIETDGDTYMVEPMWRHQHPQPQAVSSNSVVQHTTDMLVYRRSDLNLTQFAHPHSNRGFCNTESLMKEIRQKEGDSDVKNDKHFDVLHRERRAAPSTKKICRISLIADHRFYTVMGNSSRLETMYYLINLIERVNKIYKTTNWSEDGSEDCTGYGFQINQILVHDHPSTEPRYNRRGIWTPEDLLKAFSEKNYSDCLSHLFTYIDFDKGKLGLAHIGSQQVNDVGGICTKPFERRGKSTLYLNTGLTSTANWGQKILTMEADLVTAHELGHNFGAEHDDVTEDPDECSPGQSNNGNYIMFRLAVSGKYENNNKFSKCSKYNIRPVLENKAPRCFQEDKKSFCGNYQIEADDNETCDVGGYLASETEDLCCQSNCTLKPGAQCSNKNYPCCTEHCQVADNTKLCRAHIKGLCEKEVYCDGVHFYCPKSEPVDEGLECGDKGECRNGKCIQFCYTKNLKPCLCSLKKEEFCFRCCAPLNSTGQEMIDQCKPYTADGTLPPQKLHNNSTCALGYCNEGVCVKQTQDVIERVWDIFKHIAPDKIGELLADNIVGAVLVFSLLFWVPCSCLINFVDKKRHRQEDELWSDREQSRSFTFRGSGGGSAPVTPRIRIQRTNPNWVSGVAVMRAGFGARDQWRTPHERAISLKKSIKEFNDVASNPAKNLSRSQPSVSPLAVQEIEDRASFSRIVPITHARSHPSLSSPVVSDNLSDKSFDGEMKPIAASSDLSSEGEDDQVEIHRIDNIDQTVIYIRPGLRREEATISTSQ